LQILPRLLLLAVLLGTPSSRALAASAADEAAANAKSAEIMLNAGDPEQALIHFRLAYEAVRDPAYLFNMAQCEFQLGQLKEALAHYQQYVESTDPRRKAEAVEMASFRIKAIKLRKSVLGIYSVPAAADVKIEGPEKVTGQAPSDFRVPSGKYRVTVSKANHISQTSELELGIAESRSLFFNLAPIPGRLEIRTLPAGATLYVRGNRARNPYIQDVEPGNYEIYAEATDYESRRDMVYIGAGQQLRLDFPLTYVQRSGRPELIGFWATAGAIAGSTGMLARFEGEKKTTASGTLVASAGLVGGIAGGLLANAYAPDYIPDNVALFRIGAMGIGAVDGAMLAMVAKGHYSLTAGWTGGVVGLGAGALAGPWLDDYAPKYGRVTLIQSAAIIGGLAGALTVTAVRPKSTPSYDYRQKWEPIGILVGMNVGLGVGLALAYMPSEDSYKPSWKRVALVDLATAAGAFAGAVGSTVSKCINPEPDDPITPDCGFASNAATARFTLAGGILGLAAGWWLTRDVDRDNAGPSSSSSRREATFRLPVPTAMPVRGRDGTTTVVPGLATQGTF
jgi:hypothetical protein